MKNLKITYKGKEFKDIEDVAVATIIDQMSDNINKILKPFHQEAKHEGGSVTVDIKGSSLSNLKASILVNGLSEDLEKRIVKTIKESF